MPVWPTNSVTKAGWNLDPVNNRLDFGYKGIRSGSISAAGVITYVVGTALYADDTLFGIGTDSDGALINRSTILGATTALTGVVVGTPVSQAVAANSLLIGNVTADGDIAMYVQTGGNSNQFLWADASAKILYFGQTGWAVNILNGAVKLTMGTVSAFATTQPTNAIVFREGTAAAGAITTASALFASATVLRKIIADGTVSNVET